MHSCSQNPFFIRLTSLFPGYEKPCVKQEYFPSPYTALVDATINFLTDNPLRAIDSKRVAVPRTLTSEYRFISYIDCPVPVSAAKWTTTSMPLSALVSTCSEVILACINSTLGFKLLNKFDSKGNNPCTCSERLSITFT